MPEQFQTQLFTGAVSRSEQEMSSVIAREGVSPRYITGLGRAIRPSDDAIALIELVRALRSFRPHIVHTHTAKAGALGRAAARIIGAPAIVHTFHGHVFNGYFSRRKSAAVVKTERLLARISTAIVAISPRQRHDLVERYCIAPSAKVHTIPLGFDLSRFADLTPLRGRLRAELQIPPHAAIVAGIGRLTAVKDQSLLIRSFGHVRGQIHLLLVGGGEDEQALRDMARSSAARTRIHFLGFREDLPTILADTDVVVLTSKNEGTPVALIEAVAAGCSAVGVDVGGVADVLDGIGKVVRERNEVAISRAIDETLEGRRTVGGPDPSHQAQVRRRYGIDRLVADHVRLYKDLLN